jgi:sorting nexin-1/2
LYLQDQGAINAYITYKVNTSTDRPDFQYGQFSVIRRYNDFVWLSERLAEEFPGAINPPLPEKHVIGINRFEPEFIERRRKELERYLARVAAHEELSTSQYFMTFLQADDAALAEKKEDDKVKISGQVSSPSALSHLLVPLVLPSRSLARLGMPPLQPAFRGGLRKL